jgi:hypothetical protein
MISVKCRAVFSIATMLIFGSSICAASAADDATTSGEDNLLDAPAYSGGRPKQPSSKTAVQQVRVTPSTGVTKSAQSAKSAQPKKKGSPRQQIQWQEVAPVVEAVEVHDGASHQGAASEHGTSSQHHGGSHHGGASQAQSRSAATKGQTPAPMSLSTSAAPTTVTQQVSATKRLAQKMFGRPGSLPAPKPVTSKELPKLPMAPPPASTVTTKPLYVPPGAQPTASAGPTDNSLFADLAGRSKYRSGAALLRARVAVPHNKTAIDTFTAYPYPVKPPLVKWPEALKTDFDTLKNMIVDSGYLNRQSGRKPHPTFGWRWVEAYHTGLRKGKLRGGLSEPHTMITYYPWASQMVKYVLPEVRRLNAVEDERYDRYKKAVHEYAEKRTDIEMEATRDGLYPIKMRNGRNFVTQTGLPPGNWWVVGTHKVAGLTYYFNLPVKVEPGQATNVVLTEANAMVIQGAW